MRVTVVCTGNICRSPMAEVVLRAAFDEAGLGDRVTVDSAGTEGWHVGGPADRRAIATLSSYGYDARAHRGQQFTRDWWRDPPDLVLALERHHLRELRALTSDPAHHAVVRLLRSFDPALAGRDETDPELDVPDPYYDDSFERVMAMSLAAAPGVVDWVRARV